MRGTYSIHIQGNFIWLASWRQPGKQVLDIFDIVPESRASTVLDTALI